MIITEQQETHHRRGTVNYLKMRVRLFARHNIRSSEIGMSVVAAAIGAAIALGVALTSLAVIASFGMGNKKLAEILSK